MNSTEFLESVRWLFDCDTPNKSLVQPDLDLMCGWLSHVDFPSNLGGGCVSDP